jgi:hypothetical protein
VERENIDGATEEWVSSFKDLILITRPLNSYFCRNLSGEITYVSLGMPILSKDQKKW